MSVIESEGAEAPHITAPIGDSPRFNNFDILRYLDPINHLLIEADLFSLLIEMDTMKELLGGATVRSMFYIPGEGFYHNVDGQLVHYTDFYEKAMNSVQDAGTKKRFGAEMLGWKRAEDLFVDSSVERVAIASPPGDTYSFPGLEPLSATFILSRGVEGIMVVNGIERRGFLFAGHSLYVQELSPQSHVAILRGSSDTPETAYNPNDVFAIVSTPFVVRDLDALSHDLGFRSWSQVTERAFDLQRLRDESDVAKSSRRRAVIQLLKESIDSSLGNSSSLHPSLVSQAIKMVLAKEAIGHYTSFSIEDVRKDILLTTLSLHNTLSTRAAIQDLVDAFTYSHWLDEQDILRHNALFRRMMAAHGGGSIMTSDRAEMEMGLDDRMALLLKREREKTRRCNKCHGPLGSDGTCQKCKNN